MVIYPVYYRRFGIRKPEQMLKPPLPRLEMLELPRESIFHYPGVGPLDDGPIETDIIFNNNKRPIYIEHVTDLGDVQGNPRRMSVDIQRSMRMYRMKNPRFRPSRDLETSTRDPQTLLVYNYSYIHRMYKYMRTYFSNYHRWSNLNASVWKTIGKVSEQTNRHHFIEVQLPKILPSFTALKVGETVMNQKTVKIFDSAESLTLLEIWKWLGVNRKSSSLSFVKPENYSKVNFIFRESGRWFVLNMGVLDSWRIPTKTEIAEGATENKGFHTEQIQKRFLRLMISLFEARTNGDLPENLGEENESQKAIDSALTNSKNQVSSNSPSSTGVDSINSTAATVSNPVSKKTDNTGNANASGASVPEEEQVLDDEGDDDAVQVTDASDLTAVELNEVDVYSQDLENQIDADLEKLEDMGENTQNDQVQTDVIDNGTPGVKIATAKVKTLESAIIEHCNRLADAGGLSAAEYRRYIEMAGTYKTIKAPNGETLDTFIQVPKELTEIKDEPAIPDQKTIVDKTMLKSSLLQFDKNYVTNVLHRDVAAMVTNMQNAGVIITDYSVEEIEDITGSHTVHEIKIKPLQGSASTLHFKLPKVDEEGNFKVNGVNYRMRKQRGDLPIRKISPSRVALTTYYGKIFVDRSERRANNYGRWLTNSIMSIGMEAENDIVTQLIPGNCFNSDVKLPRLYTILAQSFKGFNLKIVNQGKAVSWRMGFDYNKRQELLGEVAVDTFEDDDNVVCGVNASGNVMVMSKTGVLYRVEQTPAGNTLVAQPPIEDILGISSAKMPLDFAELKIFGKAIPVAVVLCYLQGLETVVKNLGITPRIVPAGTRVQQTPDEWVIPFQDETWVFSREHELANMVLGGWRELKDTTLSYSSHEFSKPDVYLNVLEDYGLGVRYLREFDLLSQMFVDPISKELLLEMGEPTDFEGLMRRSSELLMIDQHPNELDSAYMRIKGYERFAGAVYAELVRSIRIHNARPGKSRYPIELNPYAVWIQINQDPAKNQVVEINPIQNLKEAEAVTYSGTGGRSSRSMVKRTRVYHPNDMGTISESTVDNSDVAINTYLSADPQFKNLRGISKRYKVGETGPTALLSTSGLLSVGATVDDPKRVN